MKLLCNQQAVENLESCAGKSNPVTKIKDVQKLYEQKGRTSREMRLTAQVGENEMDQVILDLGSDVNVLLRQTWK